MLYRKLKNIFLYRKISNYLKNEFSSDSQRMILSSYDSTDMSMLSDNMEGRDSHSPSQNTGSLPHIPPAMRSAPLPSTPPTAQTACSAPAVNTESQIPGRMPSSGARITDFLKTNYSPVGFAQRLNLYMYERDITTAMIYKRCFVDRKLISKITSSDHYHPSKQTVFALCIALRLSLAESKEFLGLAGYAFSSHSKYDLIIKFLLDNQVYSIDTVNDILFHFHEPCFGGR